MIELKYYILDLDTVEFRIGTTTLILLHSSNLFRFPGLLH